MINNFNGKICFVCLDHKLYGTQKLIIPDFNFVVMQDKCGFYVRDQFIYVNKNDSYKRKDSINEIVVNDDLMTISIKELDKCSNK